MIIEIKPMDTLFFRDGKPFFKGYETWADSIFPPSPATIYGAIRAAYFNENIDEFHLLKKERKLNTPDDPTYSLIIKNIILKNNDSFLFPMPLNILKKDDEVSYLKFYKNDVLKSSSRLNLLVNEDDRAFKFIVGFLDDIAFKAYIKGEYKSINSTIIEQELFVSEPKIGISIDYQSKTSENSNLYRKEMLRLSDDSSFIVEMEGVALNGDFLKLGGDSKYVSLKKDSSLPEIKTPNINKQFLIYLNTPAIFKKGWLPNWINEDSFLGKIPNTNLNVKLISALTGKPKLIGGFDMAQKRPKPMFKAVPEGSLYFFERIDGDAKELEKIHGKSISDIYPEQGFGIAYVGQMGE